MSNFFNFNRSGNFNSFNNQSDQNPSSSDPKTSSNLQNPADSIESQENIDPNVLNKGLDAVKSKQSWLESQENIDPNKLNKGILQESTGSMYNEDRVFSTKEILREVNESRNEENEMEEEKEGRVLNMMLDNLKMSDEENLQLLYQKDEASEDTRGENLNKSFIEMLNQGVIEIKEPVLKKESEGNKVFPKLDPKEFELVQIMGRGYHGAACKLRDKNHNEMVVKLFFKERKEDFFNEACVLSQCRQYEMEGEESLLYAGIPMYFEMDKYYGITLQAGFGTARDLKNYLEKTKRKLNEAQLCELIDSAYHEYISFRDRGYVHKDIKAENLVFLASLELKLIDFGFAVKWEDIKEIQRKKGTSAYMTPALREKDSKGLQNVDEAIAADFYALGLVLLEIAVPSMNLALQSRAREIEDALDYLECHRCPVIHRRILKLLNYKDHTMYPFEDLDDEVELETYFEPGSLRKSLEEFRLDLQDQDNQDKKNPDFFQEIVSKKEDEYLHSLFEKPKDYQQEENSLDFFKEEKIEISKENSRPMQEEEEEENNKIRVYSYIEITSYLLHKYQNIPGASEEAKKIAHDLVDILSKRECCEDLQKSQQAPFAEEGKDSLEIIHKDEIQKAEKGESSADLEFLVHLNNVMVLQDLLNEESKGEVDLTDPIIEYLAGMIKAIFEEESASGMREQIMDHFPCYYRVERSSEHLKGPTKKIQGLNMDGASELSLNTLMNICNSKALRVMRMLIKESSFEFYDKIQDFSRIYHDQMQNGSRIRLENHLDLFVVLIRFIDLFCDEPGQFTSRGLQTLQEEALGLKQELSSLFNMFKSGNYNDCIQILMGYQIFYVMLGSYLFFWSGDLTKQKSFYSVDGLLAENLILLMQCTDAIRINFSMIPNLREGGHYLSNFFKDPKEYNQLLLSTNPMIFQHTIEAKLDSETEDLVGILLSLATTINISGLNQWIQKYASVFSTVRDLTLKLSGNYLGSVQTMQEEPIELKLRSLAIITSDFGSFNPSEFEAFVDFVRAQRSLENLHIKFRDQNVSDDQIKSFAKAILKLKNLSHLKIEFFNCHFIGNNAILVLAEEVAQLESLKSLDIYIGGCPKITEILSFEDLGSAGKKLSELKENASLRIEPVVSKSDIDDLNL